MLPLCFVFNYFCLEMGSVKTTVNSLNSCPAVYQSIQVSNPSLLQNKTVLSTGHACVMERRKKNLEIYPCQNFFSWQIETAYVHM